MRAVYKNDKMRIEDALIPVILEELMVQHVEQLPDKDPAVYDKAFALLRPDIAADIINEKLYKRMARIKGAIFDYLREQGWTIPKAYMVVRRVAYQLYQDNKVDLRDGALTVVQDINDTIEEHFHEDDIVKQDESALKQAPKLLKFIQQQGYFI